MKRFAFWLLFAIGWTVAMALVAKWDHNQITKGDKLAVSPSTVIRHDFEALPPVPPIQPSELDAHGRIKDDVQPPLPKAKPKPAPHRANTQADGVKLCSCAK